MSERCERCGKKRCAGHEEPSVEPRGRGAARAERRRAERKFAKEGRTLLGIAHAEGTEFPIYAKEES